MVTDRGHDSGVVHDLSTSHRVSGGDATFRPGSGAYQNQD
jgi:hypothetical protein